MVWAANMPALLTTTSSRPCCATALSTAATHWASSETSWVTNVAADLGGDGLALLHLQVGDDDRRALPREHLRTRLADAGRAAGDERDLA